MTSASWRRALLWAAVGCLCAYAFQGVPAIGWYALNRIGSSSENSSQLWPFPSYFWIDPVWVGALVVYGAVLFFATCRGITTRRLISGAVTATLAYLVVVAAIPASTWMHSAPPFPMSAPVQVFIFAVVFYFNGWVLLVAPLLAWLPTRALLGRSVNARRAKLAVAR